LVYNNYGQHELYWVAFYNWPDKNLRKIYSDLDREKLDLWMMLSKSCGWWYPYKNICLVCERPVRQAIDDDGRLHHESGPALLCRDGWPVYAWHGVMVPKNIIENPENINIDSIVTEENQEIKRIMCERYGWERFVNDIGSEIVKKDRFGTLIKTNALKKYLQGEDNEARFVKVNDASTDRVYLLRVDPTCKTPRSGIASTFEMSAREYKPLQEA
jgi:hypothetical protein